MNGRDIRAVQADIVKRLGNGEALTPQQARDIRQAFTDMSIVDLRLYLRDLLPAMIAAIAQLHQGGATNVQHD